MRVFLLTALTMVAFAANSLLNRAAVEGGHVDAAGFAVLRVLAGAVALAVILRLKGGHLDIARPKRWAGAAALAIYMIGFSLAYLNLDAGLGALILFGTVQIALFGYGMATGQSPSRVQTLGAAVAFTGLALAVWPSDFKSASFQGAFFMLAAGIGWAGYTLAGRGAADPVAVTASHFLLCCPMVAGLLLFSNLQITPMGWLLGLTSGAVTSGLGYTLWYAMLPHLPGARAAVVQLSVPVIAICLGALLLQEALSLRVVIAAALVLGGLVITFRPPRASSA